MILLPGSLLVERFRRDVSVAAGFMGVEDRCGLAVSGGVDSLALLLLARAAFRGRLAAVSIDHGLRPEAVAECAFVAKVCADLDVSHETLAVTVTLTGEGVQAAAREARLRAFGDWCQLNEVLWMMTGHQADDQAETVLMRLARGSGVAGLSAIDSRIGLPRSREMLRQRIETPFVAELIRPLLGWTRSELEEVVRSAGLIPISDPSNADPRYDRTRFRHLLYDSQLLDPRRLAATASHCRDADIGLGWAVMLLEEKHLHVSEGRAELDVGPLRPWHREIMRRLLINAFEHLGARPRGAQIMRLLDLLHAGRIATLAGVKVTPRDGIWTFAPAPAAPRVLIGAVPLPLTRFGLSCRVKRGL